MMPEVPGFGYSKDDVEDLLQCRRFLAAVSLYGQDRLTLGQAHILSFPPPHYAPERYLFNHIGYERIMHEVARRIATGTMALPEDISRDVDMVMSDAESLGRRMDNISTHKFSEFEAMPVAVNPLTVRREKFTEEDIEEFIKDSRFLACVDAYRNSIVALRTVMIRVFGDASYAPRLLSIEAFFALTKEVIARIEDGRIVLPGSIRTDHPFAYIPSPDDQDARFT
ncbi:MAG: hypothetical protein JWN71_707 [Xanthobacteraceae bacterium]|nr:hypothetical protein [Xanthobacteraceae bacterium]